jgi:hypothetical protein
VKETLYLSAIACFLIASYAVWRGEKRAVIKLSGKQPRYIPRTLREKVFPPEFVTLREAILKLHNHFKGTAIEARTRAIFDDSDPDERTLDACAAYFHTCGIEIFGTRSPSSVCLELLPAEAVGTMRAANEGALITSFGGGSKPEQYAFRCIKIEALKVAIESIERDFRIKDSSKWV